MKPYLYQIALDKFAEEQATAEKKPSKSKRYALTAAKVGIGAGTLYGLGHLVGPSAKRLYEHQKASSRAKAIAETIRLGKKVGSGDFSA